MSVTTGRDGDAEADVFLAGRVRDRGAVVLDLLLVRAGPSSSVTRVVAGCCTTWAVF
jgi:hypothetical protein